MSAFVRRDGELHAEGVPLARIADAVGTPFYCYAAAGIERLYGEFTAAFTGTRVLVCYALKANPNLAVTRALAALGAGADVDSEGELRRALLVGIPAKRIVFSGVGKTRAEMELGLEEGILQFNVESESELMTLSELAQGAGKQAAVALRVNPDVDAKTHEKVATGKGGHKFGIDLARAAALYARAARLPGVRLVGLAVHIGSQITELGPFEEAFTRVVALAQDLRAQGYEMRRLDLGGGLGIAYDNRRPPSAAEYAALVKRLTGHLGLELIVEPGRALVGHAGVLVTRVLYVKETLARTVVVIDAAMNDLLRPALYNARHSVEPVHRPAPEVPSLIVDVVGPVCETGDILARARALPRPAAGDLLAVGAAGAYGAAMASTYNSRPLVPEVMVKGDAFAVVRRRPDFAQTVAQETIPEWLAEAPRARRRKGAA